MSSPIVPQTWLRDPLFALKTMRGKVGLSEEEQRVGMEDDNQCHRQASRVWAIEFFFRCLAMAVVEHRPTGDSEGLRSNRLAHPKSRWEHDVR